MCLCDYALAIKRNPAVDQPLSKVDIVGECDTNSNTLGQFDWWRRIFAAEKCDTVRCDWRRRRSPCLLIRSSCTRHRLITIHRSVTGSSLLMSIYLLSASKSLISICVILSLNQLAVNFTSLLRFSLHLHPTSRTLVHHWWPPVQLSFINPSLFHFFHLHLPQLLNFYHKLII